VIQGLRTKNVSRIRVTFPKHAQNAVPTIFVSERSSRAKEKLAKYGGLSVHEVRFITFTAWRSMRLTGSDGNCRRCEPLNGIMPAYLVEVLEECKNIS